MNEEDIKLVESLIKEFNTYNDLDGIQDLSPYMKAIENLINRNKKLEENNNNLKTHIFNPTVVKLNYIPKSKIKEKIEELEKDVKDFEEYWSTDPRRFKRQKSIDYYKLEALQELLEE